MCIMTDGSEKPLPSTAEILTDNGISIVWRGHDGWIYKRSIPFLIENELWCLNQVAHRSYAPTAERYDKYTLKIKDLGNSEPVDAPQIFREHCEYLLDILKILGIRHGDLTEYAIIVKNNVPFIIDFAESRLADDPRPDKRPEGDEYWLNRTVEKLCQN